MVVKKGLAFQQLKWKKDEKWRKLKGRGKEAKKKKEIILIMEKREAENMPATICLQIKVRFLH